MAQKDEEQQERVSTDSIRQRPRQLSGTSFLTLEHVGYFALVVIVPVLLLVAAATAMRLWWSASDDNTIPAMMSAFRELSGWQPNESLVAMSWTAGLLVTGTLLYVLRQRVAAEYSKRPGYTNRVAYKLPVYTALGALIALGVCAITHLLGVFLHSLVSIGVKGVDIGALYTEQFVPGVLALLIFGMAGWYVAWLAKGKDMSQTFVTLMCGLSVIVAVALFVTVLAHNHQPDNTIMRPAYPMDSNNYLRY